MPATIIGNSSANLAFGIPSDETGMVVQSITHSNSSDLVELKNKSGDTAAAIFRNKRVTTTVEGAFTTFSSAIAGTISITNEEKFGLSGDFKLTEITRTKSADNFQQISYTAVLYDFAS